MLWYGKIYNITFPPHNTMPFESIIMNHCQSQMNIYTIQYVLCIDLSVQDYCSNPKQMVIKKDCYLINDCLSIQMTYQKRFILHS